MTDYSWSIEMLLEALYCANTSQKVCLLKVFFFCFTAANCCDCGFKVHQVCADFECVTLPPSLCHRFGG